MWVGFLGALSLLGCGSSDPGGGGRDAGGDSPVGAAPSTFEATILGAQSRALSYTDSDTLSGEYVSCVTDGVDFFSINAYARAGGDEGVRIAWHGHRGPGEYTFTYDEPGYEDLTAGVALGAYSYHYFYDYDPTGATLDRFPSSCTIVVDDSSTDERATGRISCSAFPADILSLDYLDSPRTTLQPSISYSATFDCAL